MSTLKCYKSFFYIIHKGMNRIFTYYLKSLLYIFFTYYIWVIHF